MPEVIEVEHDECEEHYDRDEQDRARLQTIRERAVRRTVRNFYPKEALELELAHDSSEGLRAEYEAGYTALYNQALHDFGFAQARGLELGYLSNFVFDLNNHSPGSLAIEDAMGRLRELLDRATSYHGVTEEDLVTLVRLTRQATEDDDWRSEMWDSDAWYHGIIERQIGDYERAMLWAQAGKQEL